MGKYTGSMCRLCRVEGKKLFLKGRRCLSDRCAVEKKNYPPGQKGARVNFRKSHYKNQLREKQKVKRFYGVGEKQFRNVFAAAAQRKGITGENLLRSLEMRLDNVVYRLNFASSRNHARQMIRHGFFAVNGRKVNIPSYIVALNDEISFREARRQSENVKAMLESVKGLVEVPGWLLLDGEGLKAKVNALPTRDDVSLKEIEERLIVELYSK
ncbi:MAG TPA: 30S ribosomal protein S4 [Candidatus Aminicenantes bacterium]|nr:30S ribosomal protein S4 [Candidatus Aminicenantes bacterium]